MHCCCWCRATRNGSPPWPSSPSGPASRLVDEFVGRLLQAGEDPGDAAVYLGDTMGDLLLLYAVADVAFVGGSLVATGGHNMIEPAAMGRPVVSGPHLHNFAQVAELLRQADALFEVTDQHTLAERVVALVGDPAAARHAGGAGQEVVIRNRGALDRVEALVARTLEGVAT